MKKIVIVFFAILALATIAEFLLRDRGVGTSSQNILVTEIEIPDSFNEQKCKIFETDIKNALALANYCSKDAECELISGGCPFGCSSLVNMSSDLNNFNNAFDAYRQNCNACVYDCDVAPKPEQIKCVKNKCVDIRYMEIKE